jgi:hypothetical protein
LRKLFNFERAVEPATTLTAASNRNLKPSVMEEDKMCIFWKQHFDLKKHKFVKENEKKYLRIFACL